MAFGLSLDWDGVWVGLDAIGFGLGGWAEHMPDRIDVAFQLEINEWQGRQSLQANLKDIREATSK